MAVVTVRQALQAVADNPELRTDDLTQMPMHELIARELFDIANNPRADERGGLARANKARRMLFDRIVGKRRAGTTIAGSSNEAIEFVDLTAGALL